MIVEKMKISVSNKIFHKIFYSVILPIRVETDKINDCVIQHEIKKRLLLLESYLKEIEINDNQIN